MVCILFYREFVLSYRAARFSVCLIFDIDINVFELIGFKMYCTLFARKLMQAIQLRIPADKE